MTLDKATAAIVGSGNIATDLLAKLSRSSLIEPRWMVGIDPASAGLERARASGLETTHQGLDWLLAQRPLPAVVFEATSASVHAANAPRYRAANLPVVDLTPAAVGPYVVPVVNMDAVGTERNVNLITCGGQATVPIVHAVSRVTAVRYAEIVSTVASASAGPGTRANIDEFTKTTAKALEDVGGAERGKAIIVLNPADPPIMMRNTVYCAIDYDVDEAAVAASIIDVAAEVQSYVPGYTLRAEPQFDSPRSHPSRRVSVLLEVTGAGDFFPEYAGNLDIMTAAATKVGEEITRRAACVPT